MSSLRADKLQAKQSGLQAAPTAAGADTPSVTLGPRDRLIGELHVDGDVHLNGTVEGQVEASGIVEVAEAATVRASLEGQVVSISGQVEGSVTARDRLELGPSAQLTGDIQVARLVIQDGATLTGHVSMKPGGKGASKPSSPKQAAVEATTAPVAAPVVAAVVPEAPVAEPAQQAPAANGPSQEKTKTKRR